MWNSFVGFQFRAGNWTQKGFKSTAGICEISVVKLSIASSVSSWRRNLMVIGFIFVCQSQELPLEPKLIFLSCFTTDASGTICFPEKTKSWTIGIRQKLPTCFPCTLGISLRIRNDLRRLGLGVVLSFQWIADGEHSKGMLGDYGWLQRIRDAGMAGLW